MTTIDQNIRPTSHSQNFNIVKHTAVQGKKALAISLRTIFLAKPIDPERGLAKTLRREAARRAVDNLLR